MGRFEAELASGERLRIGRCEESLKDLFKGRAVGKIEKQALRLKKKIIDRKHTARKTSSVAPNPDGQIEATPPPVRIIPARRYAVKPMTAEEAALDLSGTADNFVVFRDADTNRVGVLYKRQDGNFGLIEP